MWKSYKKTAFITKKEIVSEDATNKFKIDLNT